VKTIARSKAVARVREHSLCLADQLLAEVSCRALLSPLQHEVLGFFCLTEPSEKESEDWNSEECLLRRVRVLVHRVPNDRVVDNWLGEVGVALVETMAEQNLLDDSKVLFYFLIGGHGLKESRHRVLSELDQILVEREARIFLL